MTSNLGSQLILQSKELDEKVKSSIQNLLQAHFKPEFLNRIDAIIFFKQLSKDEVVNIAKIQINEFKKRLLEKDLNLNVTPQALDKIADIGFDKEFGARPLKRAIQQYIAVPLSQFILKHPTAKQATVELEGEKITVK